MQVIKDKLRSAIIASVLITLIFLKFIPQQGFWSYTILAISVTIETGVCILDELIVTHIFRLPNDATRGYQYLNKRVCICQGENKFSLGIEENIENKIINKINLNHDGQFDVYYI